MWPRVGEILLEVLRVDHARAVLFAQLELDAGGEPPFGGSQAVVERGPVYVLGVFGEDDGRALESEGLLARLKEQLGLVVAPRAVGGSNDGFTEGGDGRNWAVENVIPVMSLGAVFYLRVAPNFLGRFWINLYAFTEKHGVHPRSHFRRGGIQEKVGDHFPFLAIPPVSRDVHCRAVTLRSAFSDAWRQGVERRARAGGQPRIGAIQQALPVLLFEIVFHSLQVQVAHHGRGKGTGCVQMKTQFLLQGGQWSLRMRRDLQLAPSALVSPRAVTPTDPVGKSRESNHKRSFSFNGPEQQSCCSFNPTATLLLELEVPHQIRVKKGRSH